MKKKILIVDDHPAVRQGLKYIVNSDSRFEVIGEAGTADEGLRLAREKHPDLVLLDISLPDRTGIQLAQELKADLPDIHIMMISLHSKTDYIRESFRAGANGYMVKDSPPTKILEGIGAVIKGEYFMDSSVSSTVIKNFINSDGKKTRGRELAYGGLTTREQQVLRYLAEGSTNKSIATNLYISPKTVENHRTNIMRKLELKTTVDLVKYAAKIGLIDVDLWKD